MKDLQKNVQGKASFKKKTHILWKKKNSKHSLSSFEEKRMKRCYQKSFRESEKNAFNQAENREKKGKE